jgi:hypothetical protein
MGLFKNLLGAVDVQQLIEAKDYEGLLKASARKDPEAREKAVRGFADLGESARKFLVSKLGEAGGAQLARSAEVLKQLDWAPGSIEEKVLFLMGLNSWEEVLALREDAIAPLVQAVRDRKPGDPVRSAALIGLGHFQRPESAGLMRELFLESMAANAPLDVYIALGCLKRLGKEAVAPLAEVLRDDKATQQARVFITQIMAMIGPPAVEALISINSTPPGTGLRALESWTFSLQALAGTADERALGYIRENALQSLRKLQADRRTESEASKGIETVLAIFKDPPRSIVKYVKLGGPMRSYQIIAIIASGNRRQAESIKAFNLMGGTGLMESWLGSEDTVTMDALDKIGGVEGTKIMIDSIIKNVGAERRAKAIMMVDRNAHPSMLEFLEHYGERSASGWLDSAAGALTLIHLKKRQAAPPSPILAP